MIKNFCFIIVLWGFFLGISGCSLRYVVKQGITQMELLKNSQPILSALRDENLDPAVRRKLNLINDVKKFSIEKLGLNARQNYQDVNLSFNKKLHIVIGSLPNKLEAHLWWFPVVGHVPYKGFFDESDANKEIEELKQKGYEIEKRLAGAYSTLGFFSDPVWPSMLDMSDENLIELLIHELAHSTIYVPNNTTFNETLANFIGKKGAKLYLDQRYGEKSSQLQRLNDYHEMINRYRTFFTELYRKLDKIYKSQLSLSEILEKKQQTFLRAQEEYEKLSNQFPMPSVDWKNLNNASLISFKSYNHDDSAFEKLLMLNGQEFKKFIQDLEYLSASASPFERINAYVISQK